MLNNWEKMNRMVRVTHEPTGVTAVASEYRSQHRNRDAAYAQLRSKVAVGSVFPLPLRANYVFPDGEPCPDDINKHTHGGTTFDEFDALNFARTIEAEVRKQDDALIQQLVEALDLGHSFGMDCCNSFAERMNGRRQDQLTQLLAEAEQILNAAKAGRARLEGKPTEPPKEQS